MKNTLKLAILALVVGNFTTACQSEYDIIENIKESFEINK